MGPLVWSLVWQLQWPSPQRKWTPSKMQRFLCKDGMQKARSGAPPTLGPWGKARVYNAGCPGSPGELAFSTRVQGPLQFPGRVSAPQSMRAGTKWIHGSAEELSQRCKKHRLSLSLAGCLFPTNMRTLHKNRVSRVSEAGWCMLSLLVW